MEVTWGLELLLDLDIVFETPVLIRQGTYTCIFVTVQVTPVLQNNEFYIGPQPWGGHTSKLFHPP